MFLSRRPGPRSCQADPLPDLPHPWPFQTKAAEGRRGPVIPQLGIWDKTRVTAGRRVWVFHVKAQDQDE